MLSPVLGHGLGRGEVGTSYNNKLVSVSKGFSKHWEAYTVQYIWLYLKHASCYLGDYELGSSEKEIMSHTRQGEQQKAKTQKPGVHSLVRHQLDPCGWSKSEQGREAGMTLNRQREPAMWMNLNAP